MQLKSVYASRQEVYSQQGSGNKKSTAGSIKAPALLFYKPSVKQENKILSRQESGASPSIYCQNHPNRVARFASETEQEQDPIYYCDKCAQRLSEQGFPVILIDELITLSRRSQSKQGSSSRISFKQKSNSVNYPFPERQNEIDNFLNSLEEVKQELGQNSCQVREILMNSEQFYGQQIEEINQYFETIVQSLELEKNKCYNHILLEREKAERDARNIFTRLAEGEKQVSSMVSDIKQNLQSVYSISWQNYQLVMDAFNNRMTDIESLLIDIRDKGIVDVEYRKIEFAGVPQSINSLSDIIIQSSFGSAIGDGTLLLNQNCSSMRRNQQPDLSIFEKLKTDYSCDSASQQQKPNHMVFSFEGERIREQNLNDQNNPFPTNLQDEGRDQQNIVLRKNKGYNSLEVVQGIKQVEELDVLVLDQELMSIPANLKLAR